MATVADIIAAVTEQLETKYNIPVIDKEIKEGFPRPAFVVETENITKDQIGKLEHYHFDLVITFFAAKLEKGWAGLYQMQESMGKLFFGKVQLSENFLLPVEEVEWVMDRKDMALEMQFEVDIVNPYYDKEAEEKEWMETLYTNVTMKG